MKTKKVIMLFLFCILFAETRANNCGFDTTLTISNGTLTVGEVGASYQWIFCSTVNYPINNAINQTYNPIFGGEYAVIINKNGCSDTSQCFFNQSIAAGGCNINPEVSNPDGALMCNVPNAIYQWINCSTGLPVAAATGEVFMPTISGVYAVAVTINNCTDTSNCFAWEAPISTGLSNINDNKIISLYPNPVEDMLYLDFQEPYAYDVVEIKDVLGKLYLTQKLNRQVPATISTLHFPSGTYFITIRSNDKIYASQRFIKL